MKNTELYSAKLNFRLELQEIEQFPLYFVTPDLSAGLLFELAKKNKTIQWCLSIASYDLDRRLDLRRIEDWETLAKALRKIEEEDLCAM